MWVDSVFLTNASNLYLPNGNCVENTIAGFAANASLDLAGFGNASVQIAGSGGYTETELNMTASSSAALTQFVGDMIAAEFYNNCGTGQRELYYPLGPNGC